MKLRQIIEAMMTNCGLCSTGIVTTKCSKCGKSVCKDCLADDTICRNCSDTTYNKQNRLRTEATDKLDKAIINLLSSLRSRGYKLCVHEWEEGTSGHFRGLFVAKLPRQLPTYKLKHPDLVKCDAYIIGRSYIDKSDAIELSIKDDYKQLYTHLKQSYPDCDKNLQTNGEIILPNQSALRQLLDNNNINYNIDIDYNDETNNEEFIHIEEMVSTAEAFVIDNNEIFDYIDNNDKPIVAKRLYMIDSGEADRWQEYRFDTKSHDNLINWEFLGETKSNRQITEGIDFEQDKWFQVLKPKEQDMIRLLLSGRARDINPHAHAQAHFFVNTLTALEELMPFKFNDRYNFMSWWREAIKAKLLNYSDESKLTDFCINQLYF